jgi:glucose-1-phosphatase
MPIKNLVFDLGQVILNLDFNATRTALEQLGIHNHAAMFGKYAGSPTFHQFEEGQITASDFFNYIRQEAALPHVSNEALIQAWNAMLKNIPEERIILLETLAENYQLFLYSNTNEIHYAYFKNYCVQHHNGLELDGLFTKAFYSHIFGKRKPNASSFLAMANDANINPQESLFIDDGEANIAGAAAIGMHTLHINAQCSIENNLTAYLQNNF